MIRSRGEEPTVAEQLDLALVELEELAKRKRPHPTRHAARALLVPLGQLVLEGSVDGLEGIADRVRAATRSYDENWRAAVLEELQLACAEYVTSVDERYLTMPSYDFDYTAGARERLEARLRACDVLGMSVPDDMRPRIADADRIFEPHLDRARGGEDAGDAPGRPDGE